MSVHPALEISVDRLWETLSRSAEIGTGPRGGLSRLALTDADREMRDQFAAWCSDAGCSVEVDRVGNIFARRPGADESQAPVVMGSHLDSQVVGGRFDGVLGVLAGLEVVRTLNEHGVTTRRPIEVVSWTNEEGARFQPFTMGSAAFAGELGVDEVLQSTDDKGAVLGEELERIGYAGAAPVGGRLLDTYLELHIEQGRELDSSDVDVGIVAGGCRAHGMQVEIHGETAHSGPTPMHERRSALVGAALITVAANDIGWRHAPEGRASATQLKAWPNSTGIISEHAQLTVDFRHPEPDVSAGMAAELVEALPVCARRANVQVDLARSWEFGAVFDSDCVELLDEVAVGLGVRFQRMLSLAAHDAYHIARVAPTAMIFSPCREGITHNEKEDIDIARTAPSVKVLLHAALARANR